MDAHERDYHVTRIVAGTTRVRLDGRPFVVGVPTREQRYASACVRREVFDRAYLEGVLDADAAAGVLIDRGLWSGDDEDRLVAVGKDLEEFKVGLYQQRLKAEARRAARAGLARARDEQAALRGRRHALDHATCEALADAARVRYLVGAALLGPDGMPVWPDPEARQDLPDRLLDEALDAAVAARLDEPGIRELARTEPWGSIWAARKHTGALLDRSAVDLLEEQRGLVAWSAIYEWAADHADPPDEEALDDDDMLDGWLILQRRRRDEARAQKLADTITNPRIANAQEVYMVVDDVAGARKVEALNDAVARNIKAQRRAALRRGGKVSEMDMPDTSQRLRMEIAQRETRAIAARR